MAYRALYRAYRPQSFETVAGQKHVTQTLKNAIKENKISHAYLFCGPRGTGKTSIAKILAKAINCNSEDDTPCNQCPNCLAITKGEHPDIIEIDAASNNGVDEVRDLIDKVKYAPINGKYKVYIIDEVHMMSTGAFNALLKTLEEPPAHVVFVLATTEPQKILPTIISRCQRFDFTKISIRDIVEYLEMVLNKEGVQFETEALEIIAQLAEGGMRDSLSILEQCLAFSGKTLTVEDVNNVYGIISTANKIHFVLQLLRKDMASVLKNISRMNENGTDIKRLTFDLIQILKDVVIYKNTNMSELLFLLDDENINQISPYITVEECFEYIDILTNAMQRYKEVSDAKIYFEIACIKICNKVLVQNKETIEEVKDIKIVDEIKKDEKVEIEVKEKIVTKEEKTPYQEVEEPIIHDYQDEPESEEVEEDDEGVIIQKEEGNDIEIEMNDILNILVQADRRILENNQSKWQMVKRYTANINTAKYATMLLDCQPVAASKGGLILACDYLPVANNLNNSQHYFGIKDFISNLLGEEYEYIAVTKANWMEIRNNFIQLKRAGQLPTPKPIVLNHVQEVIQEEEKEDLTEAQQFARDLFGDLVEIVEE